MDLILLTFPCATLHASLLHAQAKDPGLAVTQVTNAMRFLPPASVLAFNVGNEPDSYHYKDNATLFPPDYWREGWFDDVASYAEALAPVLNEHFHTTKLFSGMNNEHFHTTKLFFGMARDSGQGTAR